jgi:hypothetical protein
MGTGWGTVAGVVGLEQFLLLFSWREECGVDRRSKPKPQAAHGHANQIRRRLTLNPTLANGTREWGTRGVENDTGYQNGNRVGHAL